VIAATAGAASRNYGPAVAAPKGLVIAIGIAFIVIGIGALAVILRH
jgi:hypothetical protein